MSDNIPPLDNPFGSSPAFEFSPMVASSSLRRFSRSPVDKKRPAESPTGVFEPGKTYALPVAKRRKSNSSKTFTYFPQLEEDKIEFNPRFNTPARRYAASVQSPNTNSTKLYTPIKQDHALEMANKRRKTNDGARPFIDTWMQFDDGPSYAELLASKKHLYSEKLYGDGSDSENKPPSNVPFASSAARPTSPQSSSRKRPLREPASNLNAFGSANSSAIVPRRNGGQM